MAQQTEYENPYCPICEGCGEEGCCSPINCEQSPDGYYCQSYLRDLKFGYKMNEFFQENIYPKLSDEWKELYDKKWDEECDIRYKNK